MGRPLHRRAAGGGWAKLDPVEQLGNIGSEVERAIRAHEAGRTKRFEGALARALELFDLTAADSRWHGHRCQVPPGSADGLRRYFFGFAYAARVRHYRDG